MLSLFMLEILVSYAKLHVILFLHKHPLNQFKLIHWVTEHIIQQLLQLLCFFQQRKNIFWK